MWSHKSSCFCVSVLNSGIFLLWPEDGHPKSWVPYQSDTSIWCPRVPLRGCGKNPSGAPARHRTRVLPLPRAFPHHLFSPWLTDFHLLIQVQVTLSLSAHSRKPRGGPPSPCPQSQEWAQLRWHSCHVGWDTPMTVATVPHDGECPQHTVCPAWLCLLKVQRPFFRVWGLVFLFAVHFLRGFSIPLSILWAPRLSNNFFCLNTQTCVFLLVNEKFWIQETHCFPKEPSRLPLINVKHLFRGYWWNAFKSLACPGGSPEWPHLASFLTCAQACWHSALSLSVQIPE